MSECASNHQSQGWAAGPGSAAGPAGLPSPAPVFQRARRESSPYCQTGSLPTGTPGGSEPVAAQLEDGREPKRWHVEGEGKNNREEKLNDRWRSAAGRETDWPYPGSIQRRFWCLWAGSARTPRSSCLHAADATETWPSGTTALPCTHRQTQQENVLLLFV